MDHDANQSEHVANGHDAMTGNLPDGLSLDDVLAYAEGDLSAGDAARVETVLAAHPAMRAQVRGMRSDRAALRGMAVSRSNAAVMGAGLAENAVDAYLASLGDQPLPADVLASIERAAQGTAATPASPIVVRTRGGGVARVLLGGSLATRAVGWSLAAGVVLALGLGFWTVAERIGASINTGPGAGDRLAANNTNDRDGSVTARDAGTVAPESINTGRMAGNTSPTATPGNTLAAHSGDSMADRADAVASVRLASMDEAAALAADGRLMIVVSTRRGTDLESAWLNAGSAARFAVEPSGTRWALGANVVLGDAIASATPNTRSKSASAETPWADALAKSAVALRRAADDELTPGVDPQTLASAEHRSADAASEPGGHADTGAAHTPRAPTYQTWTATLDRTSGLDALQRAAGRVGARVTLLALPAAMHTAAAGGNSPESDPGAGHAIPVAPRLEDLLWWEQSPGTWSERVREAWLDVPVIVELRD